jgi:hypothetical protein
MGRQTGSNSVTLGYFRIPRSDVPEEERIEEEGIVGTIPIVVEAEMKIEPSVWASGKAKSSAPGEETDAMPGNERIPRPRA